MKDFQKPDRALILTYTPPASRPGLEALLALDDTLGRILRTTREPMVGQMRLTWWFEALERLDREPPPAEPVLRALAGEVLPRGVTGTTLAGMVEGWEVLLEEPLGETALRTFARERGGRLFRAAAAVSGAADEQAAVAGEGWALADLASNLSDRQVAARARELARARLVEAMGWRWSRAGRALGALALLARFDLEGGSGAGRVGRLLLHRLTGR
ncbi:squalene/phytoene synthase family protein [Sphingomonas lenta]|uniref:Phytoene synthase n=1 Tax=Sphingomonas lenta TaxID=1141887 RepID=A0A2A2SHH8_9SPHN|nr:squalene/phytoene synthase family protein [Sphingomonas lenta]PAX08471.1 hypothetical protein CKY28_03525 [Sphingomonas lenta]